MENNKNRWKNEFFIILYEAKHEHLWCPTCHIKEQECNRQSDKSNQSFKSICIIMEISKSFSLSCTIISNSVLLLLLLLLLRNWYKAFVLCA